MTALSCTASFLSMCRRKLVDPTVLKDIFLTTWLCSPVLLGCSSAHRPAQPAVPAVPCAAPAPAVPAVPGPGAAALGWRQLPHPKSNSSLCWHLHEAISEDAQKLAVCAGFLCSLRAEDGPCAERVPSSSRLGSFVSSLQQGVGDTESTRALSH